jgi:membrane protein implicated in regulation of membrane protease activity
VPEFLKSQFTLVFSNVVIAALAGLLLLLGILNWATVLAAIVIGLGVSAWLDHVWRKDGTEDRRSYEQRFGRRRWFSRREPRP